jgi:hypothetical protein
MHVPVPRRPFMIVRKTAAQQELRPTSPDHIHTPEQVGQGSRRAAFWIRNDFSATPIFDMPQKPTSQFRVNPTIVRLKRFVVRDLLPFLIRPFEGGAEERPLMNGLKQIAGTLRAMGVPPGDSIVNQIGSEFRVLFCAAAVPGKMKAQPRHNPIDPVKSISDLIREPPRERAATAALRRVVAFCKRLGISRIKRSFL